jgi:hypothetical protein
MYDDVVVGQMPPLLQPATLHRGGVEHHTHLCAHRPGGKVALELGTNRATGDDCKEDDDDNGGEGKRGSGPKRKWWQKR